MMLYIIKNNISLTFKLLIMGAKQIGWSNESNLLWDILNKINKLGGAIANLVTAATPKYKVYTALLSATGGVPVAIVLENTIGNIVWTHHPFFGDGKYVATLSNAFLDKDKLYTTTSLGSQTGDYSSLQWSSVNTLLFENDFMNGTGGVDTFDYRRIEIRVYN